MNFIYMVLIVVVAIFTTIGLIVTIKKLYQYSIILLDRRKRAKPSIESKLVTLSLKLSDITDPDELEERLSRLTNEQFQQWKEYVESQRIAALPKPVLFHDINYRLELRYNLLVFYANDFAILSINKDQEVFRAQEVPAHLGFKITQKENKVKII